MLVHFGGGNEVEEGIGNGGGPRDVACENGVIAVPVSKDLNG
jgi:hypothetical protein